ncbi:MAG TPA: YihY/virulence factor BrkB family protein [Longimicrobium sp.]|jgi:membrane protein|uniref:YihY/virulence factor BrkB family protein n=1 Tax=Longimicrobium sp. TaxID=2029185 RepID=UPI002ED95C5C
MDVKGTFGLLKRAFKDFSDDECPRMAAALSYYTVFSLPPLLILILLIAGMVFDPAQVQEALATQMGSLMGSAGAEEVGTILQQSEKPGGRGIKAFLGIAAVTFGATGAFLQLQSALNRAWEVEPDPKAGGIKNMIFKRVLSLGMVLGIAFLLLVSLALSAAISALGGFIGQIIPGANEVVLHIFNFIFSLVVITGLFAAIFKVLPDARIAWKDALVGAVFTGLLFVIGKFALGYYLGRSNPGEAFGAAGSLALVLVWIYYSSMIILFGAEFTQIWAIERGSGIEPQPGARRMNDEIGGPEATGKKGRPTGKAAKRAAALKNDPNNITVQEPDSRVEQRLPE